MVDGRNRQYHLLNHTSQALQWPMITGIPSLCLIKASSLDGCWGPYLLRPRRNAPGLLSFCNGIYSNSHRTLVQNVDTYKIVPYPSPSCHLTVSVRVNSIVLLFCFGFGWFVQVTMSVEYSINRPQIWHVTGRFSLWTNTILFPINSTGPSPISHGPLFLTGLWETGKWEALAHKIFPSWASIVKMPGFFSTTWRKFHVFPRSNLNVSCFRIHLK